MRRRRSMILTWQVEQAQTPPQAWSRSMPLRSAISRNDWPISASRSPPWLAKRTVILSVMSRSW